MPVSTPGPILTAEERRREKRAMGVMDLEVQRERPVKMLRKAESRRVAGSRREGRGARAFSRLAGFLAILR
jgi:hypothetical protein